MMTNDTAKSQCTECGCMIAENGGYLPPEPIPDPAPPPEQPAPVEWKVGDYGTLTVEFRIESEHRALGDIRGEEKS